MIFKSEAIDFVVAGKNSFQPYMGKMNFTNSPSEILFINLCPLNKDNHIKNICLYNFMITHSSKSKLKEYLIRLKKNSKMIKINLII